MTSLPFPAKTGSTCSANQPTTSTTRSTTPRMRRPSGLVSMVAINVVLQHDDGRGAVNVIAVFFGLYASLRERSLRFIGGEPLVPLGHGDLTKGVDECLQERVGLLGTRGFIARERHGSTDNDAADVLLLHQCSYRKNQGVVVGERRSWKSQRRRRVRDRDTAPRRAGVDAK